MTTQKTRDDLQAISGQKQTQLTRDDVQAQVRQHFPPKIWEKEMSETISIFKKLRTLNNMSSSSGKCRVLSLACGSAVGAEVFHDYFSHPDSTFIGMDIIRTQTVEFLQMHGHMDEFLLADLYAEPTTAEAIHLYSSCTHWMAIHACRALAERIVHLFRLHAPRGAHLIIVPCCLMKDTQLKSRVGYERWQTIRNARQVRDSSTGRPTLSNWRLATSIQLRNELLAAIYPKGFVDATVVLEIQSLHNVALHFHKSRNDENNTSCDNDSQHESTSKIWSVFDSICIECK
jgi:hypothetical protein